MNSALNHLLHHVVRFTKWNVSRYKFSYLGRQDMTCGFQHGNAGRMEFQQFY